MKRCSGKIQRVSNLDIWFGQVLTPESGVLFWLSSVRTKILAPKCSNCK